jgi:hypothetical protein
VTIFEYLFKTGLAIWAAAEVCSDAALPARRADRGSALRDSIVDGQAIMGNDQGDEKMFDEMSEMLVNATWIRLWPCDRAKFAGADWLVGRDDARPKDGKVGYKGLSPRRVNRDG